MSSIQITASYTDKQLQTVKQTAEILGPSAEDLLRVANHPGKIADLKSVERSATAPKTSNDERGVLTQVPTTYHLPQVIPDGMPLLNHNVQNTENLENIQAHDNLLSDFSQNPAWLQQDALTGEAVPGEDLVVSSTFQKPCVLAPRPSTTPLTPGRACLCVTPRSGS